MLCLVCRPGCCPVEYKALLCHCVSTAGGVKPVHMFTAGLEAAAACGQLRNDHQKQPLDAFAVPA